MTGRAFAAFTESVLVDTYGRDAVDAWLEEGLIDEVAARRKANAMAAILYDGELG